MNPAVPWLVWWLVSLFLIAVVLPWAAGSKSWSDASLTDSEEIACNPAQ